MSPLRDEGMRARAPGTWRIDPGGRVAIHHWGDEVLVHHLASNDTHRLDPAAGWVLEELASGPPGRLEDLLARAPFETDPEDLQQALLTLESLGFVQRC